MAHIDPSQYEADFQAYATGDEEEEETDENELQVNEQDVLIHVCPENSKGEFPVNVVSCTLHFVYMDSNCEVCTAIVLFPFVAACPLKRTGHGDYIVCTKNSRTRSVQRCWSGIYWVLGKTGISFCIKDWMTSPGWKQSKLMFWIQSPVWVKQWMTKDSKRRDMTVVGGRRGSFRHKEKGIKKKKRMNNHGEGK